MATPDAEHRDPPADAEGVPEDADTLADDLADEPEAAQTDADPDHESAADAEPGPRVPFYSVSARGVGGMVSVRAGWLNADGDVDALLIDATVGTQQAGQAQSLALTWYQNALRRLYSAAGAAEEAEEEGEAEEQPDE